jgi:hypothetical protein
MFLYFLNYQKIPKIQSFLNCLMFPYYQMNLLIQNYLMFLYFQKIRCFHCFLTYQYFHCSQSILKILMTQRNLMFR